MSNSKSVQQTVAREGPLVRGVSRPVVGASKQQTAIVIPDASSSMAGTKIDEVNAATMALVTELAGPKCRDAFSVGLVYFNSTADTLLAPKKATALSPADVAVPQNLGGGMTNTRAGSRSPSRSSTSSRPGSSARSACS